MMHYRSTGLWGEHSSVAFSSVYVTSMAKSHVISAKFVFSQRGKRLLHLTICPVCLSVVCDSAIIPRGQFVLHMSSDTNFDCYRVCTLPYMQNWHFWHPTSPFLDVTVSSDAWQLTNFYSCKFCNVANNPMVLYLEFSVGVAILQYRHSFYVQNF